MRASDIFIATAKGVGRVFCTPSVRPCLCVRLLPFNVWLANPVDAKLCKKNPADCYTVSI